MSEYDFVTTAAHIRALHRHAQFDDLRASAKKAAELTETLTNLRAALYAESDTAVRAAWEGKSPTELVAQVRAVGGHVIGDAESLIRALVEHAWQQRVGTAPIVAPGDLRTPEPITEKLQNWYALALADATSLTDKVTALDSYPDKMRELVTRQNDEVTTRARTLLKELEPALDEKADGSARDGAFRALSRLIDHDGSNISRAAELREHALRFVEGTEGGRPVEVIAEQEFGRLTRVLIKNMRGDLTAVNECLGRMHPFLPTRMRELYGR